VTAVADGVATGILVVNGATDEVVTGVVDVETLLVAGAMELDVEALELMLNFCEDMPLSLGLDRGCIQKNIFDLLRPN
jgi:hypothetical protein